tara:strand:+ start:11761 stop:11961 length:201 start_codon:yes stop_codon:yes gene_type:complete
MNFKIATQKFAIDNVFDFHGRASRWECWGGSLLFSILLQIADNIIDATEGFDASEVLQNEMNLAWN